LGSSLQEQWTNKSSANISVSILTTHTQVYDARTLRKGDEIQIRNYFGSDHAAVQENSDNTFAPLGTKLGTTAAHTWEFLSIRKGTATRPVQRETWNGGLSFLFMRFGPLLEEMFTLFNLEVKEAAEGVDPGKIFWWYVPSSEQTGPTFIITMFVAWAILNTFQVQDEIVTYSSYAQVWVLSRW
jgi:hypothetical protein